MNRIDNFFNKNGDRKVFVPYITAGHPGKEETLEILDCLVNAGSDIIELGFPFSDPTADGPVIQYSSQYALNKGFSREDYFDIIRQFRAKHAETPLVVFSYFNPIFNMGVEHFSKTIADAGADAVLVVDLPFEEQDEIRPVLDELNLHLIQLIAPTTPDDRAEEILLNATGFVYQIALKGVTGERQSLAEGAEENAKRTKSLTTLPVCMGFGVSNIEMAKAVAKAADGVVVGSALVRKISDNIDNYLESVSKLATELSEATHSEAE
jgi:tryptophan synthase alpha chain